MQIHQLTPYSLENIKTDQFFARSNLIRLVALNRLPYKNGAPHDMLEVVTDMHH